MKLSECGSWTLEKLESELAKLRARPSPTGTLPTGRQVVDVAPAPTERQGIDYHTSTDMLWTMTLADRLAWTARTTEELRKIDAAEVDLPDQQKTRFYRGGVEWKP